jgi:hypothetical protein
VALLVRLCLLTALAAGLAGCKSARIAQAADTGELKYRDVQLVYDVNGRYRDLPISEPGVELAEHEAESRHQWKSVRLQVDYPHPEGIPEVARATLRLSMKSDSVYTPVDASVFHQGDIVPPDLASETRPMCDDEIWILDIPRPQLDSLLVELNEAGFFQSQMPNEVGTRLEVRIDGGRTAKTWMAEPRLDDFVHRIRTDGRLSGFVTCGQPLDGPAIAKR